jgi:hypothetical protein
MPRRTRPDGFWLFWRTNHVSLMMFRSERPVPPFFPSFVVVVFPAILSPSALWLGFHPHLDAVMTRVRRLRACMNGMEWNDMGCWVRRATEWVGIVGIGDGESIG